MALRERFLRSAAPAPIAPRKHDVNEVITLRLGDFVDRVPASHLSQGKYDSSQSIVFEVTKMAKQIIEGRPTVGLVEIYRQAPSAFSQEVKVSDHLDIRFPWPRLVEMVRSAHKNTSEPGLTRAGALHLARLLRGFRGPAERSTGKAAAGSAAQARAPQWFTRNVDNANGAAESEQILEELAALLEQFSPGESPATDSSKNEIETSDAFAITVEENNRLRKDVEERDREIESLRKTLTELENAAIDQIAALNQQFEEFETAKAKPAAPHSEEIPLNPQQTTMIDALSHQVSELYNELDRAREDALQATAAHARYREQNESSEASAASMQQYLASIAHELERANALLKEMEAKAQETEAAFAVKEAETERLKQELLVLKKSYSDLCVERDALRGRLYASSPGTGS
jgi:hypothetical protein